jgi:hypothetical protein
MAMQGRGSRRIAGGAETGPRGWLPCGRRRALAGLALCLVAVGCSSINTTPGPSASATSLGSSGPGGFSVAFESIDGLPRDVSQQLVRDLNEEAASLRIAVVPAGGEATFRLRGYLAAHAERSATSIVWAWDVYDGELNRAFRLSGQEQAPPAPARDAGRAMSDEAVLRAIARAGMRQLADFAASAPAPATPAAPTPGRIGSAVASRDDMRPEPGYRDEALVSFAPAAVPLPQRRPVLAGLTAPARLADATSGR